MKQTQTILTYLNKFNLAHLFTLDDLNYFTLQRYKKNEYIASANSKSEKLYLILKGEVDVHSILSSGKSIFINKLNPSDLFGDVEFLGGTPTLFDVIATKETLVLTIPFSTLKERFKNNSVFWRFLGTTSTKKLLTTNKAILLKEGHNLKNILAIHIEQNNFTIHFESLVKLAEELNVSYRNLTRVIKFFADSKIIEKRKRAIVTLDKEQLLFYTQG